MINGLGSSVSATFNGLAKEMRDGICSAFATLLVDLVDGVCNISSENDGDNRAVPGSFPRILPEEFATTMPSSFAQEVINRFRSRLEKAFGECYIGALEEEHRFLRDCRISQLKVMLNSMRDTIRYHDAWVSLQPHLLKLCEFSSGLATINPRTTRVESDFLILRWERDKYLTALMDCSLERYHVYAKQCRALLSIA
jgi:hypothetical protein